MGNHENFSTAGINLPLIVFVRKSNIGLQDTRSIPDMTRGSQLPAPFDNACSVAPVMPFMVTEKPSMRKSGWILSARREGF